MVIKEYGGTKAIFKQLEKLVNHRVDLLAKQLQNNPELDQILKKSLLIKEIENEIGKSTPLGNKILEIKNQLIEQHGWDKLNGHKKHDLLLDAINDLVKQNTDSIFNSSYEQLKSHVPEPNHKQKQAFYDFILMLSIIGVANPYIKNSYLMHNLPKSLKVDIFQKSVIDLLVNPNEHLADPNFFPTTTNRHANSVIRILLLEKLDQKIDAFDHWNTFFPYDPPSDSYVPQLKSHTKKMFGVSQSLSKNRYNQDLRLARGKFLKNVGYVTLTAAAIGGIAIAGGATIAAGALTGGIALIAVGVTAVLAFAYYRYRTCSSQKNLIAAQEKILEAEFNNRILDPTEQENLRDSINTALFDIAKNYKDIEDINAKTENELVSIHGSSVTSKIIHSVKDRISQDLEDELKNDKP